MHEIDAPQISPRDEQAGTRWLTVGGIAGALLASTCCVAPLVLLLLGVSGVWIGNLTALEPYKPVFALVALAFIGLAFRRVYVKPKAACATGSFCARPGPARLVKSALWLAAALVLVNVTTDFWAPFLY